jgi:hypothetical protein
MQRAVAGRRSDSPAIGVATGRGSSGSYEGVTNFGFEIQFDRVDSGQ